jgi:hypothetical protein
MGTGGRLAWRDLTTWVDAHRHLRSALSIVEGVHPGREARVGWAKL